MTSQLTRAEIERWDQAALVVHGWSRERYEAELRSRPAHEVRELALMRYRWDLHEFRDDLMRPILARTGKVSPPNALDDAVYDLPLDRWWDERPTLLSLVMTGRGVGKTTRARIKHLHAALYGLSRVAVTIAQSDEDATGWVDTVRSWIAMAQDEGMALARLFPELQTEGDKHRLNVVTRFGVSDLLAKGWGASLRGLNVRGHRPDSVYLDDVESEEKSVSESTRNRNQAKLTGKVLPLGKQSGGMQVVWCQTPVHPDAVAARADKGHPELAGWSVTSLSVISRWPDDKDGWERLRAVYFDVDEEPSQAARETKVRELYEADKENLDRGAIVLDPVNMGVLKCHLKLWQIGPSAFAREYEMNTSGNASVFHPAMWPRHRVDIDSLKVVRDNGQTIRMQDMKMHAHLDPSDGGDDAALVVEGMFAGRCYEVGGKVWQRQPLSVVTAEIPGIIAPLVKAGLRRLHWEPPSGAASVVERDLRKALDAAGLQSVALVREPAKGNKNQRIVNTLEPKATAGLLSLRHDTPRRLLAQAEDFNPADRNNRDDWLDAKQRCVERLTGGAAIPKARSWRRAPRR